MAVQKNFRLPEDLARDLSDRAHAEGVRQTEIVVRALQRELDRFAPPDSQTSVKTSVPDGSGSQPEMLDAEEAGSPPAGADSPPPPRQPEVRDTADEPSKPDFLALVAKHRRLLNNDPGRFRTEAAKKAEAKRRAVAELEELTQPEGMPA